MKALKFSTEELIDLIERLRRTRFRIGVSQHITAQNLLLLLASHGRLGDTPRGLKTLLAPVLCSSPEEQAAFYKLFEEWLEERRSMETFQRSAPSRLLRNKWLWLSVAAVAVVAAVVAVVSNGVDLSGLAQVFGPSAPQPPDLKKQPTPAWALAAVVGFLALAIAMWLGWNWPRTSGLVKWRGVLALRHERLKIKGIGRRLFAVSLHELRRHRLFASGDININATVDATARNVGWFTPVYGFRKRTPEYLLLIDRAGFGDHQAALGEALYQRLRDEGVSVARYFFQSDPRLCRTDDPMAAHLTLEEITELHPQHDLIIFGDSEVLLNPLTGQPAPWLNRYAALPSRILLTPTPRALWGYHERILSLEGLRVITSDSVGVASLAEITSTSLSHEPAGWRPDYPEALEQRPGRWIIEAAPSHEELKELRFQLRLYLGAEGYQWLCACAVYPVLSEDLTLYLGLGHDRIGFEENLSKLVQLPWFRHGVMPDWLRRQLISDLEPQHEREVRQALSDLLLSCTDEVCDPVELEILLRREEPQARLAKGYDILRDHVTAHPESRLRDKVLLTIMSGRKLDPLTVGLPPEVRERLQQRDSSRWLSYLLTGVLLALAYYILIVTMLFPDPVALALGILVIVGNVFLVFQILDLSLGDIAKAWRNMLPRPAPPPRPNLEETSTSAESHPKGLYALFAAEMWERFSFYSMLAMFALYMRDTTGQGFAWSVDDTQALVSNYLMFVYASPLVGGWIADKKLGYRKSVMIGALFFVAGHLLLAFRSLGVVYAALTCLVIGNGFFKPNVSAMVGNLYPEGSHLKDRAYSIFYMGINVGAFTAPIVMELVQRNFGYHPAFAVAAGGMLFSLSIMWWFRRHIEAAGAVRRYDVELPDATSADVTSVSPTNVTRNFLAATVPDWKRVGALIVIFLIVMVFWMVFHQNSTTITYWGNENTDWAVSGIISNSINPGWVLVLTFPLVWFWGWLDKRGLEPSTPTKMVFGMVMVSLAFIVLFIAAKLGEMSLPTGVGPYAYKMSPLWLIGAYGILTLGELMLSPMGLSLVSKVAPERKRGLMMGGWFVATAIGNKLTQIGQFWDDWLHSTFWIFLSACALVMAGVLLFLLRPLKKAMPEVVVSTEPSGTSSSVSG